MTRFLAASVILAMMCAPVESRAQAPVAFTGAVLGASGKALEGATVSLYRQGVATTGRTADGGQFRVGLPSGGQIDYVVFEHGDALPRVIEGPLAVADSRLVVVLSPRKGVLALPAALAALHAAQFMKLVMGRQDVAVPAAQDLPPQLRVIRDSIASAAGPPTRREFGGEAPKEGLWPMDDPFFDDVRIEPPAEARADTGDASLELDRWLTGVYPADSPGAAVLVKHDGRVLLRKGYGAANLEWRVPVNPETVFRLASVSKQFTAVAILMLVQEGRVALDAPVTRYVPGLSEPATIEQLLTHTSGIRSLNHLPGYALWSKVGLAPRETIGFLETQPRAFAPGEGWEYTDAGYLLLGLVIEAVSGQAYPDFMQQRIFTPLGMSSTYYDTGTTVIPNRASGYTRNGGRFQHATGVSVAGAFSAGAIASTVDDLARWDEALAQSRLVRPDLLARAFEPVVLPDGTNTRYGYGWLISESRGARVVEHGGRIAGFETHLVRVPGTRTLIAVLTNAGDTDPAPAFVARSILERLQGGGTAEVELGDAEKRAYLGVFRVGDVDYEIAIEDGRLSLRNPGGARRWLVALGADRFRFTTSYSELQFVRNAGNAITGLAIKTPYEAARAGQRVD
jgi:D-alanyl-D-alanine carboxypeptidase